MSALRACRQDVTAEFNIVEYTSYSSRLHVSVNSSTAVDTNFNEYFPKHLLVVPWEPTGVPYFIHIAQAFPTVYRGPRIDRGIRNCGWNVPLRVDGRTSRVPDFGTSKDP